LAKTETRLLTVSGWADRHLPASGGCARTPVPAGGQVDYILADHLGSSVKTIRVGVGVTGWAKYYPYGSARSDSMYNTDKKFTGQQQEADSSLDGTSAVCVDGVISWFNTPGG
jgi:hypothetical protein